MPSRRTEPAPRMQVYRVTGWLPALIRPPELVVYNPAYPGRPFTVSAHLEPEAFDLTQAVAAGRLTPRDDGRQSPAPPHLHLVEG